MCAGVAWDRRIKSSCEGREWGRRPSGDPAFNNIVRESSVRRRQLYGSSDRGVSCSILLVLFLPLPLPLRLLSCKEDGLVGCVKNGRAIRTHALTLAF